MGWIKTTTTASKYVMATFTWLLCNTFAENSQYTVSICTLRPVVGFLLSLYPHSYFHGYLLLLLNERQSHRKKQLKQKQWYYLIQLLYLQKLCPKKNNQGHVPFTGHLKVGGPKPWPSAYFTLYAASPPKNSRRCW